MMSVQKLNQPVFLDIEASSLSGRSYPIEIAWSLPNGEIECYMINPYLYPREYVDWSPDAQAAHGLSRKYLMDKGEAPSFVVERMLEALSNQKIYTNAPDFDGFWIRRLFSAVDKNMSLQFIDTASLFNYFCPEPSQYDVEARKRVGGIHRASFDVKYLIEKYRLCIGFNKKYDR